jgi:hypothetical protein
MGSYAARSLVRAQPPPPPSPSPDHDMCCFNNVHLPLEIRIVRILSRLQLLKLLSNASQKTVRRLEYQNPNNAVLISRVCVLFAEFASPIVSNHD